MAFLPSRSLSLPLAARTRASEPHRPLRFGDFVDRTVPIGTGEGPAGAETLVLTAGTRAGLAVDIECNLGERWAVRLEGTFTKAPLRPEPFRAR